jgi:hypothetical protein
MIGAVLDHVNVIFRGGGWLRGASRRRSEHVLKSGRDRTRRLVVDPFVGEVQRHKLDVLE